MRSKEEILEEIEILRDCALLANGSGLALETAMREALKWAVGEQDRRPSVLLAQLEQTFPCKDKKSPE